METAPLLPSEYNSYFKKYIDQATDYSLPDCLRNGLETTLGFFKSIPTEKHEYLYEEGKWTPKEILQHLIDTERVFAYRALQFARAEDVVLKGFDQDEFASNANANARTLEDLLAEYLSVRNSTIQFAQSCSQDTLLRKGVASNGPLSVRAALYIVCGHEIHHCAVIKERYL